MGAKFKVLKRGKRRTFHAEPSGKPNYFSAGTKGQDRDEDSRSEEKDAKWLDRALDFPWMDMPDALAKIARARNGCRIPDNERRRSFD